MMECQLTGDSLDSGKRIDIHKGSVAADPICRFVWNIDMSAAREEIAEQYGDGRYIAMYRDREGIGKRIDAFRVLGGEIVGSTLPKNEPGFILEELKTVFKEKNEDYGNSWEKASVVKRMLAHESGPNVVYLYPDGEYTLEPDPERDNEPVEAVQLSTTPENHSTFEQTMDDLFTRLLDKLNRAYTLSLLKDEPALDNEGLIDAWKDLTGYASMGAARVRREQDDAE